jgi:hypothetical protein
MQKRSPAVTPKRRWRVTRIALIVLVLGSIAALFRFGLVPGVLNPLPAVDLGQSNPWFIDWRLAALKDNPDLCRRVLVSPHIEAQSISDSPLREGCGWVNAVRMSTAGGVRAGFDKLTCEAAAALALWLEHDLQEVAQEHLGQRVMAVQSFGTFSCRNIIGNPLWKGWRSQHATANAVDIGGFTLSDGRRISVRGSWHGDGAEARFLRAAHGRACRYFRVVLGPDFNAAHHDHFHFDRGPLSRCK